MPRKAAQPLEKWYNQEDDSLEIGIDEAGRGPMLGPVYSAAVILPKTDGFKHELMKDSKRFHSGKKIREAAQYIKDNAVAWAIGSSPEAVIDSQNIRTATHRAMHVAITNVISKEKKYHLLVDGNDFKPYMILRDDIGLVQVRHTCIEGGDNKYTSIAAASILAKVGRDDYIAQLCEDNPQLDERYGLLSNKGYGTKIHMEGIQKYGISPFHRKSFGICRNYC